MLKRKKILKFHSHRIVSFDGVCVVLLMHASFKCSGKDLKFCCLVVWNNYETRETLVINDNFIRCLVLEYFHLLQSSFIHVEIV